MSNNQIVKNSENDFSSSDLYFALQDNNHKILSRKYSDEVDYKGVIRLEITNLNFIFDNMEKLPLSTAFMSKYAFINNEKICNHQLNFLFKIEKDFNSQKIFKLIKEGKITKIFDDQCKLYIENQERKNILLLTHNITPSILPEFITDYILKTPEENKLNEILWRCTHKLVSELLLLLPRDNYISSTIDETRVVYCYNNEKQLYKIIKNDMLRASLQKIAIAFVNSIQKDTAKILSEIKKSIEIIRKKIDTLQKSIKKSNTKAKNREIEKTKNQEIEKLNTEIDSLGYKEQSYNDLLDRYNKVLRDLETLTFMDNVTKTFITEEKIIDNDFANNLDKRMDVFNFKNGLVDLCTGEFRQRNQNDYFSAALNYDWKDKSECDLDILNRLDNEFIFRICNDDKKMAECYKSWLGYCMTGETDEQKAWWSIGQTAQNGKTTIVEAFEKMAHIYCVKLNNKTFNERFTNRHKQLSLLKLIRMAYIEEVDRDKMDVVAYKDCTGGDKVGGNEILFGTAESIEIFFKLIFISNKFPKFSSDDGIKRRGFCAEHTNLFLDNDKYKLHKHKKGVYKKITGLIKTCFNQSDYKLAFFHLLLPYAVKYYTSKFDNIDMKPLIENWENICFQNDNMKQFIDEKYEITNNDANRVHKDDFLKDYQLFFNLNKISWNNIINDIKRIGLVYDRFKTINNKRGVIIGLIRNKDPDPNPNINVQDPEFRDD